MSYSAEVCCSWYALFIVNDARFVCFVFSADATHEDGERARVRPQRPRQERAVPHAHPQGGRPEGARRGGVLHCDM